MRKYLVKRVKGKVFDYVTIPKGATNAQVATQRRKHFKGYKLVKAPSPNAAFYKAYGVKLKVKR